MATTIAKRNFKRERKLGMPRSGVCTSTFLKKLMLNSVHRSLYQVAVKIAENECENANEIE